MYEATQTQIPTDTGHALEAWAVTGTAYVRPGQQGEALAVAEAARLNLIAARSAGKSDDGDEEKTGGEGTEGMGSGALRRHCFNSLQEMGVELSGEVLGREHSPDPHHPTPAPQAPGETQAALTAQYRDRIKFHRAAGLDTTMAVARAAREVPGYMPPVAGKKRRKVI